MKIKQLLFYIPLLLLVISCGSHKKTVEKNRNENVPAEVENNVKRKLPSRTYSELVQDYIRNFGPIAQEEMRLYHIPASITLAQGILESGAGRSELTLEANNHFGIKCHDWQGEKVYHDDDRRQECFRKYKLAKYSYRDHSLFLSQRRRYADLFELDPDDYKRWAKGLRADGYATDRRYPGKLINLIERYDLERLDNEVLSGIKRGNRPLAQEAAQESPSTKSYIVRSGDTLYSISKRYNLSVEDLKRYNNLADNTISLGQELFLEPNR